MKSINEINHTSFTIRRKGGELILDLSGESSESYIIAKDGSLSGIPNSLGKLLPLAYKEIFDLWGICPMSVQFSRHWTPIHLEVKGAKYVVYGNSSKGQVFIYLTDVEQLTTISTTKTVLEEIADYHFTSYSCEKSEDKITLKTEYYTISNFINSDEVFIISETFKTVSTTKLSDLGMKIYKLEQNRLSSLL